MLRNVIVHIANEQPFMADLLNDPSPSDVSLICRNMRTMNGKKPVYVDFADSTFVLPVSQLRFIEIPAQAYEEAASNGDEASADDTREAGRAAARVPQGRGKRPKTVPAVRPAPAAADRSVPAAVRPKPLKAESEAETATETDTEPQEPADTIVLLGSTYHDVELDGDLLRRIREA